jgi:hypothetical protein
MPVNQVVLAKIVSVAEKMLKPDIVASKYIETQLEPKFHLTPEGKVRGPNNLKVRKYLDTIVRGETPSIFLEVGQADKGGNVKGRNNPFSAEGWSVSKQGALLRAIGAEKTAAIAASVGSRIGATRPGATKRLSQAYEKGSDGRPVRIA